MRHLAYIVIALFLTGASCTPLERGAVPAECETICFMRCTNEAGDTGVRWRSEPETADAWDALGGEVVPALAERVRICETRRTACVQCLRRLHRAEVIDLGVDAEEATPAP